jgi:OmpA-OmpF porin, OOP family
MKKLSILVLATSFFNLAVHSQLIKKLGNKVKDKTEQRADQKVDNTIDKGLDKAEDAGKKNPNQPNNDPKSQPPTASTSPKTTSPAVSDQSVKDTVPAPPPALKAYNNYDFVPGDKILFEDNFTDDQDGEFPTHWELKAGQAVLNKIGGEEAFLFTDGNYVRVLPRMKKEQYLAEPYTIEYDYYHLPGAYQMIVILKWFDKVEGYNRESHLSIGYAEAGFSGNSVSLNKTFPEDLSTEFDNKWHHVAIAVKNHQIKVYVDQFRVLVVPDSKEEFTSLEFAGIGAEKEPVIFRNIRIAAGGNMNMIGKKFTDSKIITHGINFDYNKATIKPESMGTINMIVGVLKDNPEIKFEVGGHTDSDGADAYNLKLSQQRAEAVREQLIKMGVDASRLTAKGYGETKPIADNTTPDGKANNRRVEFVKY